MSRYEGVSRIAKVIRGIGWLIVALGILGVVNSNDSGKIVLAIVAAVFAGACFAIAWIVDGFAK